MREKETGVFDHYNPTKMNRFKIGQKVVCIKEGEWRPSKDSPVDSPVNGPKYGDICTVELYREDIPTSIFIVGYTSSFKEYRFEPLMDITELVEVLQSEPLSA